MVCDVCVLVSDLCVMVCVMYVWWCMRVLCVGVCVFCLMVCACFVWWCVMYVWSMYDGVWSMCDLCVMVYVCFVCWCVRVLFDGVCMFCLMVCDLCVMVCDLCVMVCACFVWWCVRVLFDGGYVFCVMVCACFVWWCMRVCCVLLYTWELNNKSKQFILMYTKTMCEWQNLNTTYITIYHAGQRSVIICKNLYIDFEFLTFSGIMVFDSILSQ